MKTWMKLTCSLVSHTYLFRAMAPIAIFTVCGYKYCHNDHQGQANEVIVTGFVMKLHKKVRLFWIVFGHKFKPRRREIVTSAYWSICRYVVLLPTGSTPLSTLRSLSPLHGSVASSVRTMTLQVALGGLGAKRKRVTQDALPLRKVQYYAPTDYMLNTVADWSFVLWAELCPLSWAVWLLVCDVVVILK